MLSSSKYFKMAVRSSFEKFLLLLLASASMASAQIVIYSDDFGRTGNLDGSSPTIDPSGTTWQSAGSGTPITTTGSVLGGVASTNHASEDSINGVLALPTAYLDNAGSLIAGTYTFSMTLSSSTPANGAASGITAGFGTLPVVSADPWNVNEANDNMAMANINLLLPTGQSNADVLGGPHLTDGNSSGIDSNHVGITTGSAQTFVLSLTSNGSAAPWTLSATLNGTALTFNGNTVMTYAVNGDPITADFHQFGKAGNTNDIFINGFGTGDDTFSNLSLTYTAVPEPSTYAMMIAGWAILGFCLRRKNTLPS